MKNGVSNASVKLNVRHLNFCLNRVLNYKNHWGKKI